MKSSVAYYFSFDNGINVCCLFYSIKNAEEHGNPSISCLLSRSRMSWRYIVSR